MRQDVRGDVDVAGRPPPWRCIVAFAGHAAWGVDYSYTRELADYGFAVLSPRLNYHEEPEGDWSLQQQRIEEARIALDYLDGRGDMAGGYVAVGLSLGGDLAFLLAAADKRIGGAVVSGAVPSLRHEPGEEPGRHWEPGVPVCECGWVPGLAEAFNGRDLALLVSPRPLVFESGFKDRGVPADDMIAQVAAIRPAFGGALWHVLHPGGHVWADGPAVGLVAGAVWGGDGGDGVVLDAEAVECWPVVRVVDGDTIRVIWRGLDEPVRLLRIDTPERGEAGFSEAAEAMRGLVEGRRVRLVWAEPGQPERDRWGRLLAYVFVDDMNVNVEMVRLGWTPFWTRFGEGRFAEDFERAEAEARAEGRGLWAEREGED